MLDPDSVPETSRQQCFQIEYSLERRLQSKTEMFYKIFHQLVALQTAPYLITARLSREHDMHFFLSQSSLSKMHLFSSFPSTLRIYNQPPLEVILALRCSSSGCHSSTPCKEILRFQTVLSAPQLALLTHIHISTQSSKIPGSPSDELTGRRRVKLF